MSEAGGLPTTPLFAWRPLPKEHGTKQEVTLYPPEQNNTREYKHYFPLRSVINVGDLDSGSGSRSGTRPGRFLAWLGAYERFDVPDLCYLYTVRPVSCRPTSPAERPHCLFRVLCKTYSIPFVNEPVLSGHL